MSKFEYTEKKLVDEINAKKNLNLDSETNSTELITNPTAKLDTILRT
jgi:hypothetical protein